MNELRNMQALDATESSGQERASDGAASSGELRARKAVGVLPAARELPEARGGNGAGAGDTPRVVGIGSRKKGTPQTRLSHLTFAMILEELLSGPCTAQHLSEYSGMGHRYVRRFMQTLRARKVAHISAWDKDSVGRVSVMVFALGPGKDAPRKPKSRAEVQRAFRVRAAKAPLKGTPFYGLGA